MAKPVQRKPPPPRNKPSLSQHLRSQSTQPPLLVHPLWILKALAAVLVVALLCSYGTLLLLYWQGEWQLVLHPSRNLASTPAALHLPSSEVHFFDDASGQPRLDGWWIPAGSPTSATALMLHSGSGSMSDALPSALTLHNARLNVFVFDYRGFGRSSTGKHPTQESMQADADAALAFLTSTKHLPPRDIVLYGSGLGASLAVRLASAHHDIPALILDTPDGDFADRAGADPRSRLIPSHWLFTQTFPLAAPLHTLATPKLLISYTAASQPPVALSRAADPKMTVELTSPTDPALLTAITRFLDLYLPTPNS